MRMEAEVIEDLIDDVILRDALHYICSLQQASPQFLQRKLKIGYLRSCAILDKLEQAKILGPIPECRHKEIKASQFGEAYHLLLEYQLKQKENGMRL